MIESVKKLRSRINDADSPVLYKWWFKYDGKLFDIFVEHKVDKEKLEKKVIDGVDYYALYIGIARSCISRFRWHIIPSVHHTPSAVKSGVISTLRKTLCALLDLKLLGREDIESASINAGYYPLNIQSNRAVPKEWLRYLKDSRKAIS